MAIASTDLPRRRNPSGLGTVYALADPRTGRIRYIGKTLTVPRDRLKRHLSDAARGKLWRVSNWLRSLPTEPKLVVLEECAPALLGEAEADWIAYFRSLGTDLTNLTDGGGSAGFTLSAETREKIGAAHRGKVVTAGTRAKLSAARRDPSRPCSRFRDRKSPEEVAAQASARMKERWRTQREEMLAVAARATLASVGPAQAEPARTKRSDSLRAVWADPVQRQQRSAAISIAKRRAAI